MPLTPEQVARLQQLQERLAKLQQMERDLTPIGERFAEAVEKPTGILGLASVGAGLAGLGLGFVPHPIAQGASAALKGLGAAGGAVSSVGSLGAGLGRFAGKAEAAFNPELEADSDILRPTLEVGLGALGVRGTGKGLASILQKMRRGKGIPVPPVGAPPPTGAPPIVTGPPSAPPVKTPADLLDEWMSRPDAPMPPNLQKTSALESGSRELSERLGVPKVPSLKPPAPTGPEVEGIRLGREKLAGKVPQGVSGGVMKELDRMGLEYRRTAEVVTKLRQMTAGDEAAGITGDQWKQAYKELGHRLQIATRVAGTGKVHTGKQLQKAMNAAMKEAGFVSTELATRIALAGMGAAAGASAGDTPMERALFAAGGGLVGGAIPGAAKALKKNPVQALEDFTFFSLLSHPATLARAGLGGVGGAITKATEMMISGVATGNPAQVQAGSRILKAMLQEGTRQGLDTLSGNLPGLANARPKSMFFRFLQNPNLARRVTARVPGRVGGTQQGVMGLPGRFLGAGDATAIRIMAAGGVNADEAAQYTLAGTPTTQTAQKGVELLRGKTSVTKVSPLGKPYTMTENLPPALRVMATQAAPFPRTAAQLIERGLLERTPGIAQIVSAIPSARRAISPGVKLPDLFARQALGGVSAAAGYEAEDEVPQQIVPFISAMLGPNSVPFMLAFLARRAARSGKPPLTGLREGLESISPLARDPMAMFTNFPSEAPTRLVPGAVAAIAQALDPAYERAAGPVQLTEEGESDTGALLGRLRSRIPLLRNKLPELQRPVDVYGQPRVADMPAISKLLFPNPRGLSLPPAADLDDPNLRMIHEAGVKLSPPSGDVDIPGTGVSFETSSATKAKVQQLRGRGLQLAVELIASSPEIQQMPPGPEKNMLIRMLLERFRESFTDGAAFPTAMLSEMQGGQR